MDCCSFDSKTKALAETAGADALLADYEPGHSTFQIERFIIERGNWTPWGKLQQALREIQKRRQGVAQLHDEIALAQVERVETRRRWCFRETSRRRRAIRVRQLNARIDELRRNIITNRRELNQFVHLARECATRVGPVDAVRRAELEMETWMTRIRAMAAIDVLTRGGISASTLELICAIPTEDRESILNEIRTGIERARETPDRALLSWLDELEKPREHSNRTFNSGTKNDATDPAPAGFDQFFALEPRPPGS